MNTFAFYMTCATIVMLVIMGIYIVMSKNKRRLHYIFMIAIIEIFIWNGATIWQTIFIDNETLFLIGENLTYIGSASVAVTLLLMGHAYSQSSSTFKKRYLLILVIPVLTQIMVWTNGLHGWFYTEYGMGVGPNTPAWYFWVHAAYSYVFLVIAIGYHIHNAVKNSGIWSAHAVLIIIGSIIPTATNILYTFQVPGFDMYSTPIAFAATLTMYLLGMFRFNLLRITPVALQTVINRISDSFIVIDDGLNVLDYNKTFEDTFPYYKGLHKGADFYKILVENNRSNIVPDQYREIILQAVEASDTLIKDIEVNCEGKKLYFTVEFTPITKGKNNNAVVLLFKNVTQHIRDMQKIQDNQAILLERERLASLGQMIGGIAHNLKTPIMSVAGGIDQIKYLAEEYRTSIGDKEVTNEDHYEIAQEMEGWLQKMKGHLGYMSDIISTVKDQTTTLTHSEEKGFTLDETLKRVGILMQHEISKNRCRFTQHIEVPRDLRVRGDVNSLVQVLDNIIVNAIQSYDGRGGEISLRVNQDGGKMQFIISDFGKGIPSEIKTRLFKEMVTTKGKHGTGLGLYMSYSTVRGMFEGDMWVESSVGIGTDFYIQLPIMEEPKTGDVEYA